MSANADLQFIRLLEEVRDIDYGRVIFTPKHMAVELHTWYTKQSTLVAEEAAANALVTRLFGEDFTVTRYRDIGHTTFAGQWNGLGVQVKAAQGAFCEKVQVGEQVIPAQPAQPKRIEPVYEWQCADPIVTGGVK